MTWRRAERLEELVAGEQLCCYSPMTDRLILLEGAGRLVWDLCDGRRGGDEIADRVAAACGEGREAVAPAVHETLRSLATSGFLVLDARGTPGSPPT